MDGCGSERRRLGGMRQDVECRRGFPSDAEQRSSPFEAGFFVYRAFDGNRFTARTGACRTIQYLANKREARLRSERRPKVLDSGS